MKGYAIYHSTEFKELLSIEHRMPKMVDVAVSNVDDDAIMRFHRWRRTDCAAFLRAGKFRPYRRAQP